MTAAESRNLGKRTQASDSGRCFAGLGLEDSGGHRHRVRALKAFPASGASGASSALSFLARLASGSGLCSA